MKKEQSDIQNTISEYEAKNKNEDKKQFKPFIIIMIICVIVGIGAGKLLRIVENDLESIKEAMTHVEVMLAYILPSLFLLINIVEVIFVSGLVGKQEKRLKEWDGEDEEILDDIERKLDLPLNLTNFGYVSFCCLWVVCLLTDFAFHTGLFPIAVVLLIWLVQVLTYSKEASRLECGGK